MIRSGACRAPSAPPAPRPQPRRANFSPLLPALFLSVSPSPVPCRPAPRMGGGLLGGGRQLLHRVSTGSQPAQAGGRWRRGPGSARPPPHRPRTSAAPFVTRGGRAAPCQRRKLAGDAGSPGPAPAVGSNRLPWRRHLSFLRLFGVFRRGFVGELAAPSLPVIAAGGALPCRAPAEVEGARWFCYFKWLVAVDAAPGSFASERLAVSLPRDGAERMELPCPRLSGSLMWRFLFREQLRAGMCCY